MRLRKIRAVIIVLIILGIIFAVWWLADRRNSLPESTISASGTIEATEVEVSPKVAARLMELKVEEGSRVTQGQIIARLGDEELKAQVRQAQGAVESAQARLQDLLAGFREEEIRQAQAALAQAEASVQGTKQAADTAQDQYRKSTELKGRAEAAKEQHDAAQGAYDQAKARFDLIEAGARPETIDQLKAQMAQAESAYKNATEDYGRVRRLFEQGALSQQQLDAAQLRRDSTKATLDVARSRLQEAQAGARSEDRRQAKAALEAAAANLRAAKKNYETAQQLYADRHLLKAQLDATRTQHQVALAQAKAARARLDLLIKGPTQNTIDAARGQLESAEGQLKQAQALLAEATVRAPITGVVTVKVAEPGELVTPGMPIVTLADLDHVWLRVYIPEVDLGKVKIGQQAEIRSDTYPEKAYPGRVIEIAEQPEFTPKNVQTKEQRVKLVFGVKITVENPNQELKPGLPADATILIGPQGR